MTINPFALLTQEDVQHFLQELSIPLYPPGYRPAPFEQAMQVPAKAYLEDWIALLQRTEKLTSKTFHERTTQWIMEHQRDILGEPNLSDAQVVHAMEKLEERFEASPYMELLVEEGVVDPDTKEIDLGAYAAMRDELHARFAPIAVLEGVNAEQEIHLFELGIQRSQLLAMEEWIADKFDTYTALGEGAEKAIARAQSMRRIEGWLDKKGVGEVLKVLHAHQIPGDCAFEEESAGLADVYCTRLADLLKRCQSMRFENFRQFGQDVQAAVLREAYGLPQATPEELLAQGEKLLARVKRSAYYRAVQDAQLLGPDGSLDTRRYDAMREGLHERFMLSDSENHLLAEHEIEQFELTVKIATLHTVVQDVAHHFINHMQTAPKKGLLHTVGSNNVPGEGFALS